MKIFLRHRRYCRPEASDPLGHKVSCGLFQLLLILTLVLEVSEVEAIDSVRLQLQKARCNYMTLKINGFAANVAGALEYQACVFGDYQLIIDELAIDALAAVKESGKEACSHAVDDWQPPGGLLGLDEGS